MAFKGTCDYRVEEEPDPDHPGKKKEKKIKILFDDHCLSNHNLNVSKWPDSSKEDYSKTDFELIQRLGK